MKLVKVAELNPGAWDGEDDVRDEFEFAMQHADRIMILWLTVGDDPLDHNIGITHAMRKNVRTSWLTFLGALHLKTAQWVACARGGERDL